VARLYADEHFPPSVSELLRTEVIREALLLLDQQDKVRQMRIEKLRHEIAIGIEQAERGDVFDGEEVVRELLEEIDTAEQSQ
jgi:antitoxin ParD1/3/4